MNLAWSPAALDDLKSAVDYIEFDLDSPKAAERFYGSVLEKAELFADVPGSGIVLKTANGIDTGYRYMLCGNWMIFFIADADEALVVRILYGKSNYMRTLFGDVDQRGRSGLGASTLRQLENHRHPQWPSNSSCHATLARC